MGRSCLSCGATARSLRHGLIAVFAFAFVFLAAAAQEPPHLPGAPKPTAKFPGNDLNGLTTADPRTAVPMTEMPWRALGRIEAGGLICTGALVAPTVVLTAAHCMFDPTTRHFFAATQIRFHLAYDGDPSAPTAQGRGVTLAPGYDPVLSIANLGNDWALIELDHAVATPAAVLAISDHSPQAGDQVALAGYSRDRAEHLTVDPHCHVLGLTFDRGGMPLLRHDCSATHGVSGAPLLRQDGDVWRIVGIDVAARTNGGGSAVLPVNARAALPAIVK